MVLALTSKLFYIVKFKFLLITDLLQFFGLVLVIFIVQIVGGILAFVYYPSVEEGIVASISQYGGSSEEAQAITAAWNTVQEAVSKPRIWNFA